MFLYYMQITKPHHALEPCHTHTHTYIIMMIISMHVYKPISFPL